jgi:hypothetical protein
MLCVQWLHGSLPNCKKTIKKMINSRKVPSEMVMRKFAICDDGFLRNERMETVREKQKSFADTRKENANKRWEKSKNDDALAMHVHDGSICITDALHSSSSTSSSIRVLSNDNTQSEKIYNLYPKKVGKDAALKAIKKALAAVDANTLERIVTEYAESQRGADMQFIPNPSTWFNQGRWQDDQSTWRRENKQSRDDRHPNELKEETDLSTLPVWDATKQTK